MRTTGKKSSNTLVRDLVNVGIFGALYLVLSGLGASIGFHMRSELGDERPAIPFLFESRKTFTLLCATLHAFRRCHDNLWSWNFFWFTLCDIWRFGGPLLKAVP